MKEIKLKKAVVLSLALIVAATLCSPVFAADGSSAIGSRIIKTKISGRPGKTKILKYSPSSVKESITISHAAGRSVYIEKLSGKKWKIKKTCHTRNVDASGKIRVVIPEKEISQKTSLWRIRVPEKRIKDFSKNTGGGLATEKTTVYSKSVMKFRIKVGKMSWPLKGRKKITSKFGSRYCPFHGREFHGGVDIPAPEGTKVRASFGGIVTSAGWDDSMGENIVIKYNGKRTVQMMYNHLSRICVRKGEHIKEGQIIGKVGSTGDSTGPHLDFRVLINGKLKDPVKYAIR